jgi:hypothetical protein
MVSCVLTVHVLLYCCGEVIFLFLVSTRSFFGINGEEWCERMFVGAMVLTRCRIGVLSL